MYIMGFEDRGGDRQMYDATCAKCQQACQVPFKPTEGRPVYCRNCYKPKPRYWFYLLDQKLSGILSFYFFIIF